MVAPLVVVRFPSVVVEPVVPPGLLVQIRGPPFPANPTLAPAACRELLAADGAGGLELRPGLLGLGLDLRDPCRDAFQRLLALRQQLVVPRLPLGRADARVGQGLRGRVVSLRLYLFIIAREDRSKSRKV